MEQTNKNNIMNNKIYWDDFYKKNIAPVEPSDFAKFTLSVIRNRKSNYLLDIACGNGRDSSYFISNNIQTDSIDLACLSNSEINFIQSDMLTFDYSKYNILYLRFVFHTIVESDLDALLNRIKDTSNGCLIFIETRSTKGVTDAEKSETFFKSSIGDVHYRMLYSLEYLTKKLSEKFKILMSIESSDLAEYNGDNPYCIRYILKHD
jgi:hypothetical protein